MVRGAPRGTGLSFVTIGASRDVLDGLGEELPYDICSSPTTAFPVERLALLSA
jgi:hypothetical protein